MLVYKRNFAVYILFAFLLALTATGCGQADVPPEQPSIPQSPPPPAIASAEPSVLPEPPPYPPPDEAPEYWISLDELQIIWEYDARVAYRVYFDEDRQVFRASYDARYNWDIETAFYQGTAYALIEDVDYILELTYLPLTEQYTPGHIEALKYEKSLLVRLEDVQAILFSFDGLTVDENGYTNNLHVVGDWADMTVKVYFAGEFIGSIERAEYDKDEYNMYMKKEEINVYLVEYGIPEIW